MDPPHAGLYHRNSNPYHLGVGCEAIIPPECTTEDLMDYNEATKECVFQWINNMTRQEKDHIHNVMLTLILTN